MTSGSARTHTARAPHRLYGRRLRPSTLGLTREYAQRHGRSSESAGWSSQEISSQVEHVAIVDRDGSLLATTVRDAPRAARLVAGITRLLDEADRLGQARGLPELTQLEASTLEGSVFAVRRDGRMIAATTRPDPTVGLVFYDLKHCLGSIEETSVEYRAEERCRRTAGPAAQKGGRHLCVSR